MGVVYLAEHRVMETPRRPEGHQPACWTTPTLLDTLPARGRAAAQLDHPNIVPRYDADQAGDLHFLVMEFVEGVSLAGSWWRRGRCRSPSACDYVRQAALGLQHAHEHGLVHRDIKPHNLMLTPRGMVKVLDFGLARCAASRRRSWANAGGLVHGDAGVRRRRSRRRTRARRTRADIYSLGCTLYVLLTGRPPFVEDTAVKLVLAHIEKEPRPLHELRADVPAGLSAVVAKMLAKEAGGRYPHPVEVAQALEPFVKAVGKPITAAGASGPPRVAASGTGTIVGGTTSPGIQGLAPEAVELFPREPVSGSESETPCGVGVDDVSPPTRPHSAVAGTKAAALAVAKRLLSLPWLILIFLFGFLPWSEVSCESFGSPSSGLPGRLRRGQLFVRFARGRQRRRSPEGAHESTGPEHEPGNRAHRLPDGLFAIPGAVLGLGPGHGAGRLPDSPGQVTTGPVPDSGRAHGGHAGGDPGHGHAVEQRIHTAVLAAYRVDSVPGLKMTTESPSVKTGLVLADVGGRGARWGDRGRVQSAVEDRRVGQNGCPRLPGRVARSSCHDRGRDAARALADRADGGGIPPYRLPDRAGGGDPPGAAGVGEGRGGAAAAGRRSTCGGAARTKGGQGPG